MMIYILLGVGNKGDLIIVACYEIQSTRGLEALRSGFHCLRVERSEGRYDGTYVHSRCKE